MLTWYAYIAVIQPTSQIPENRGATVTYGDDEPANIVGPYSLP